MILERIAADSRRRLESRKQALPPAKIKRLAELQPAPLDLAAALRGERIRLIAEVKRASPSRGVIRQDFNPVEIARTYAAGGAAAVSVLTEEQNFQGSLGYLSAVRKAVGLPLLRKDFIFDDYQVYEARAYRADALLLIVALLSPARLAKLLHLSHALGMRCLVEAHDEAELEAALKSGAEIIGINNRDLRTFSVDIATTGRLRPLIPPERLVVSESGIKSRSDMEMLQAWGVHAALVGEALVSAPDIAARMKELL